MVQPETELRGAHELVRFLVEHDHRHVFGLPGSSMVSALYELQGANISYVPAIHESVAIAMADGYSRVAGSAVAMLYMLHGVANGMANLYNAWRDESRIIVLASQQSSHLRTPGQTIGEGDVVGMVKPYTRLAHELSLGMPVRRWLEAAHRASAGPQPGPVVLSLPEDVLERTAPSVALRRSNQRAKGHPDLAMVADALANARKPLIVVGGQLRRFGGSEAIERIAADHAISLVFESGFNDRLGAAPGHPNMMGNISAHGAAAERAADVVLLIGSRAINEAHPRGNWFPSADFIAHINNDPSKLEETVTADWSYACNPADAAEALEAALGSRPQSAEDLAARRRHILEMKAAPLAPQQAAIVAPYAEAVAALHGALDRGWVVDESVMGALAFMHGLKSADGSRYVSTTGAALGWGTGAAAGVALASGEPVTCVIGDGSLRFGALGLWSIRACNLPITLVVVDNGGYGSTRFYERSYLQRLGSDAPFPRPSYNGSDFRFVGSTVGGIIEGFGIPCHTVAPGEDARQAVESAWANCGAGPNAVVVPLGFEG
jgi:thiamine pyrophosphate-dependent acetolactate synthase large subunit-like protein